MSTMSIGTLLKRVISCRKRSPDQLADDLGLSHLTVHRWLLGRNVPSMRSCRRLAEYSGMPLEKIIAAAGHLSGMSNRQLAEWPEFREYVLKKYADVFDDDLITMVEDLIERGRPLCNLKQVSDGISTNRGILPVERENLCLLCNRQFLG